MAASHLSCIDIKGRGKKNRIKALFFRINRLLGVLLHFGCISFAIVPQWGGIISPTERQSQRVQFTLLNSFNIISAALKVNWFY